jgi:hypothetical protein
LALNINSPLLNKNMSDLVPCISLRSLRLPLRALREKGFTQSAQRRKEYTLNSYTFPVLAANNSCSNLPTQTAIHGTITSQGF